MENGIHVALSAERLGEWMGLPITNTLITSWIVVALLAILAFSMGSRLKLVPGRFQTLLEWMIGGIYDYVADTLGGRDMARKFFPLVFTIFLFILVANWLEFIPGVGSVGFFAHGEFAPLFRSVNTDLNVTLALAAISFIVTEITGIAVLGFLKYGSKFLNFHSFIGFIVGIIELFSEVARLISFSFRLFGNIIAGEILILVATHFLPYAGPVPLMMFEVFVGFIQAAIFAILTLFFIKIAIMEPVH
ncbi:ATP synthase F0 subunit A [Candidatus Kaiserbacteria bacterium RIFCSPHIGHO2_02_FULL_59_21]|uniref:ATP synthase subunit a n=2 Tax=Candidatus Kaiseribacteriota TaxID=1752734 RepID=A0A0G2BPF6_9BACT|nr:MAG: ATP synthase subunit a [Candidatus Kaiserbacteria bacterium GW2011_GWA2_58_9]OGG62156.1 MAG: ATP synthase F0 subunit A [Candidatus Kaiserbacteria bacterium RIFCSPHIGHO2_01_FULL_58_22]OGG66989.1 MAG: ATP synthase F0 subunit A [Candidatus Kaiserbacteria bacterium RIFCSPHIGHO2_02_FULL_59_21]OGG78902.1 MAG: ATP synthase F0 subunit A [Candidatus Kaiserbacteria bacterium RIFCSPLOWO2_01_FULL_59_34]OGG85951.1 MAG: ATP synthase F0 subunit A [Candidatus Kaiserbacteria bacterium RIFCSPLOWO2_02_FUL